MTPLLLIHICSASVGLLSGFLAIFLRKGSGWHGAAGSVFFVSMLTMSSSAAYIAAFHRPNAVNVVVGLLTFYLVMTAWRAARRRDGGTGLFDWTALLFILGVAAGGLISGFEAAGSPRGMKDGMPAAIYFVFGSIALLCGVTDIRMLVRGGVSGAQRIARHLWRMSLALLIATLSFFPGQARQLPDWLRQAGWMYVPHLLLVASMLYWIYRVKVRKRVQRGKAIAAKQSDGIGWQSLQGGGAS
jgi:hypothetical protein